MSDKMPIAINKYPNRRFYDTVNSRHVTLEEIHDLIISGKDIVVTDTRTGEDLTNVVLMQILLERDHVKLDLLPSSIIHMMIRSSRNTLRTTLERFFGPFLGIMAATQKQFDAYLRESMKGPMVTPFDWTKGIFPPYSGSTTSQSMADPKDSPETRETTELDELREQLEHLRGRVMEMNFRKTPAPKKKKAVRKPKRK